MDMLSLGENSPLIAGSFLQNLHFITIKASFLINIPRLGSTKLLGVLAKSGAPPIPVTLAMMNLSLAAMRW